MLFVVRSLLCLASACQHACKKVSGQVIHSALDLLNAWVVVCVPLCVGVLLWLVISSGKRSHPIDCKSCVLFHWLVVVMISSACFGMNKNGLVHVLIALFILGFTLPVAAQDAPGASPGTSVPVDSWRADPVVLFDLNVREGGAFLPAQLMVKTSSPAIRKMLPSLLPKQCDVVGMHLNQSLSHVQCAGDVSLRNTIATLFSSHNIWSEALFKEHSTEGEGIDPEEDYDLDIRQWHHRNLGQNIAGVGVAGADMNSVNAWLEIPGDTPGVLVAVIDSGIDFTHPELAGLAWKNSAEVCDNNLDDDNNGYIDDCDGWDFGDNDKTPSPRSLPTNEPTCKRWHGTFIAGLSTGLGDNQEGVAGVHWGSKLINVKKHDDATCTSTTMQSILAVEYAVAQGAKILQMSFGTEARSAMFEQTLKNAAAQGVLLVISAGNNGRNIDVNPLYPASYDLNSQLVVAYTNNRDELSPESNFGSFSVDIAAPGEKLYAPDQEQDYQVRSGSSYSVPLVAGAASLIWAAMPELSSSDIVDSIIEGARPLDTLSCASSPSQCVASGARLDAMGAIQAASTRLKSPSITVEQLAVLDFAGDGFLSAGEQAQLQYVLYNRGLTSSKLAVSVEVFDPFDAVTVTPAQFTVPSISSRQRFEPDSTLTPSIVVSPSCSRNGEVDLIFTIRDDESNIWVRELTLQLACGLDQDQDGVPPPFDCQDNNPLVAPGFPESCDNIDNNCNGQIDEQPTVNVGTFYLDQDSDGFGSTTQSVTACVQPAMYVTISGDCDDSNPLIGPFTDASGQPQCGVYPSEQEDTGCVCATSPSEGSRMAHSSFLWYLLGLVSVMLVRIRRQPRASL